METKCRIEVGMHQQINGQERLDSLIISMSDLGGRHLQLYLFGLILMASLLNTVIKHSSYNNLLSYFSSGTLQRPHRRVVQEQTVPRRLSLKNKLFPLPRHPDIEALQLRPRLDVRLVSRGSSRDRFGGGPFSFARLLQVNPIS